MAIVTAIFLVALVSGSAAALTQKDQPPSRREVCYRRGYAVAAISDQLQDVDLGAISERHVMIPMRDATKLSAYLYFPPGDGQWPVLFEQRYADLRGAATRKSGS